MKLSHRLLVLPSQESYRAERIGSACDGLPLAIRWVCPMQISSEAVGLAEKITISNRHGEEL